MKKNWGRKSRDTPPLNKSWIQKKGIFSRTQRVNLVKLNKWETNGKRNKIFILRRALSCPGQLDSSLYCPNHNLKLWMKIKPTVSGLEKMQRYLSGFWARKILIQKPDLYRCIRSSGNQHDVYAEIQITFGRSQDKMHCPGQRWIKKKCIVRDSAESRKNALYGTALSQEKMQCLGQRLVVMTLWWFRNKSVTQTHCNT